VKLVAVAGSLAGAVWLVTGERVPGVPDGVAALAVLAAGAVALWLGQRLVYRADAAAAARTSPTAVAAAIERYAELNDVPMSWGRVAALRRMEPPLDRRLDRLGERDGRDNGESEEGGRESDGT
jgi:Zn-dependent protease with chaperone function